MICAILDAMKMCWETDFVTQKKMSRFAKQHGNHSYTTFGGWLLLAAV